jgi:hypothetical protein
MTLPPRRTPSAAMTHVAPALAMRDASESREKPPKTTVCTAPIRAHASMAMASSGTCACGGGVAAAACRPLSEHAIDARPLPQKRGTPADAPSA